jgi:hypothetical protein
VIQPARIDFGRTKERPEGRALEHWDKAIAIEENQLLAIKPNPLQGINLAPVEPLSAVEISRPYIMLETILCLALFAGPIPALAN